MNKGNQNLLAAAALMDARENEPSCFEGSKKCRFTMVDYGHTCGTPACVLGSCAHAGLLPGYALRVVHLNDFGALRALRAYIVRESVKDGETVDREDVVDFDDSIIQEHFDVTRGEARDLFDVCGCNGARTPKEAADFIRAFVAKREQKA